MTNQLRIALIGHGKMGRAIEQVAAASDVPVVAIVEDGTRIDAKSLHGASVAIEFTEPGVAVANVKACIEAGVPVVVGTTGWYDRLDELTSFAHANDGTFLWAANFSLGVHAVARLMRDAGQVFSRLAGFDVRLVETHHAAKKDAPSGTGIMLQHEVESTLGRTVPVTSIRVGSVPGTHTLIVDGAYEQIVVSHEARDRRVFADGALIAARWLVGRRGVFTLDDMLDSGDEG